MLHFHFFIVGEGLGLFTVVFHNHDLKIRIIRLFIDGFKAGIEGLHLILVRNQNRHQRLTFDFQAHFIEDENACVLHFRLIPQTGVMLSEGLFAGLDGIGLAVLIARCGGLRSPPVIENLRDMVNPVGLLDAAKQEIVILGSVTFLPKKAGFLSQTSPHHNQMADIVDTPEKIRVEVRFHPG